MSNGITRNPEDIKGASSGKSSSIGAKTSWKQDPIDFSSIPVQSWKIIPFRDPSQAIFRRGSNNTRIMYKKWETKKAYYNPKIETSTP